MFIESFLTDTHRRAELQKALSILHGIGFFSVLLEMSYKRSGTDIGSQNILEASTFQRGFSLGYYQCISDIYDSGEVWTNILSQGKKDSVDPDWGATKILSEKGFTPEEIKDAKLKLNRSNSRSIK